MKKIAFTLMGLIFLLSCSKPELRPLKIETSTKTVHYNVEVAQTQKELEKGLMYRKHLALNSGMIFLFDDTHPQPIAMWMKNTYISLDMLFLSKDFSIIGIAQNTQPMSLKIIRPTKEYVAAVVELNAGEVKKHGIKVGDKITF